MGMKHLPIPLIDGPERFSFLIRVLALSHVEFVHRRTNALEHDALQRPHGSVQDRLDSGPLIARERLQHIVGRLLPPGRSSDADLEANEVRRVQRGKYRAQAVVAAMASGLSDPQPA